MSRILKDFLYSSSLRTKLVIVILLSTMITLVIGVGILVYNEVNFFEGEAEKSSMLITQILGEFSIAPLSFEDPEGAKEVLSRLSVVTSVKAAGVYDSSGSLFAQYVSANSDVKLPPNISVLSSSVSFDSINTLFPITLSGDTAGFVYLTSSTEKLKEDVYIYIRNVIFILIGVGIIAIILASWLSKVISKPIVDLEHTAKEVTDTGNYAVNLAYEGTDEIAELYKAFNEMLFAIRERQAEKDRLADQLSHAQRLETIGTLAGGIAHDFNNILTPLINYVELARRDLPNEHKANEHLSIALESAERARELTNQILTFGRGGQQGDQIVCLCALVEQVVKLLRATIPTTISIETTLSKDCFVKLDPSQLHQTLMNLCTNAFHAMANKGGTLEIIVDSTELNSSNLPISSTLDAGRYHTLIVRDTGPGMEQETVERIFEPFFTTKAVGEGTGLGLSVVHGIITNSGGDISVKSQPGMGTEFKILLPAVEQSPVTKAIEPSVNLEPTGGRILFVDDEELIGSLGKQILERHSYQVQAVTNPETALKLFEKDPYAYDLVITDQTMPSMTGTELIKKLIAIREGIPIILTSGYASDSLKSSELPTLGVAEYLKKPYTADELLAVINKAMPNSKSSGEKGAAL